MHVQFRLPVRVTKSVPQISDCPVIYASTIARPQLASTSSSST